jgi:hypothetical protein
MKNQGEREVSRAGEAVGGKIAGAEKVLDDRVDDLDEAAEADGDHAGQGDFAKGGRVIEAGMRPVSTSRDFSAKPSLASATRSSSQRTSSACRGEQVEWHVAGSPCAAPRSRTPKRKG